MINHAHIARSHHIQREVSMCLKDEKYSGDSKKINEKEVSKYWNKWKFRLSFMVRNTEGNGPLHCQKLSILFFIQFSK